MLSLSLRLLFLLVALAAASPPVGRLLADSSAAAQAPRRIVISNEGADIVTIIDAASLRIAATVRVGPRPHNLAALPGGPGGGAPPGARGVPGGGAANGRAVRRVAP